MTLTINAQHSYSQRAILRVVRKVWDRGKSLPFDQTYTPADTYGNRYLYPGMVVAKNSDETMYVPWSSTSSYGSYSTYACGIIDDLFDCTFESQIVSPATRCVALAAHCYVYGTAMGTIPDAVKQATGHNFEMRLVQWE